MSKHTRPATPVSSTKNPAPTQENLNRMCSYLSVDSDDGSDWMSDDSEAEQVGKKEVEVSVKLRTAAEEVNRQQTMFSKLPRQSYANAANNITTGFLSRLLNPDPLILTTPRSKLCSPTYPKSDERPSKKLPLRTRTRTGHAFAGPPLAAQVTPSSVRGLLAGTLCSRDVYPPKAGSPEEDFETDVESNSDNDLPISRSLAEQKLAAIVQRVGGRRQNESTHLSRGPTRVRKTVSLVFPTASTTAIPLNYPYNLPTPEPLMTPSTTRRRMLSAEMSASFRLNLLWARKVITRTGPLPPHSQSRLQPTITTLQSPSTQVSSTGKGVSSGNCREDRLRSIIEENRRNIAAYNRKWTDDFHYAGW
ncbi:hypothetical protein BDY19DRAFT_996169 [Irpex rosettiformis]|uniref:Uncharacterized protein n=1 Tax=Irpex rosettiformis TaxID=378272 RepID=A0ACB8TW35_9APHY|nr:hypothetical protein BDY19DRAFT_996169 [Irpex rosettiformis]